MCTAWAVSFKVDHPVFQDEVSDDTMCDVRACEGCQMIGNGFDEIRIASLSRKCVIDDGMNLFREKYPTAGRGGEMVKRLMGKVPRVEWFPKHALHFLKDIAPLARKVHVAGMVRCRWHCKLFRILVNEWKADDAQAVRSCLASAGFPKRLLDRSWRSSCSYWQMLSSRT